MRELSKFIVTALVASQLLCPCLVAAGSSHDSEALAHHGAPDLIEAHAGHAADTALDAHCDPIDDCCDVIALAVATKAGNETQDDDQSGPPALQRGPAALYCEPHWHDPPAAHGRSSPSPVQLEDLKLE